MGKAVNKKQCPACAKVGEDNSRDNLAIYEDGTDYCFKCGYTSSKGGGKNKFTTEFLDIPSRKLSKKTCEKLGISSGLYTGFLGKKYVNEEPIYVFNMSEGNEIYAQKIRAAKDRSACIQTGDRTKKKLFGQSSFSPSKKWPITITEGELDAASIYEATGYPVVSITNGAQGAAAQIAANIDWLSQWKHVILCFDNDDPGREAVKKSIPHFEPGTVKVAKLPLKDANDMIVAGRGGELKSILWNSEVVRPKTIVSVKDLAPRVLEKPKMGMPWPWEDLTLVTRGFRTKEIYVVAGPTGAGKTEFVKEMMFHLIDNDMVMGVFSFEQDPSSTLQRLVGNKLNQKIHDPMNEWWDEEAIQTQLENLDGKIYLYDNVGSLPWEETVQAIRYMVKCFKTKVIVLDNLTAMCSNPVVDGKRLRDYEYTNYVMGNLFSLVHELDVSFVVVAHLAKDKLQKMVYLSSSPKNATAYNAMTADDMDKVTNKEGTEWDNGRMPVIGNIAGGDVVSKVADYVLGLGRNRISKDPIEKTKLKIKVLKSGRIDSSLEGHVFNLYYDSKRGKLLDSVDYINVETETKEEESEKDVGI